MTSLSLELTLAARNDDELSEPVAEGLRDLFNSYYEILHDTFATQGWDEVAFGTASIWCAVPARAQGAVAGLPQPAIRSRDDGVAQERFQTRDSGLAEDAT